MLNSASSKFIIDYKLLSCVIAMQFTWHLLVIIAAILFGVCLFQMGEKNQNMSAEQLKNADMYRMYAYILWGVAGAVAIYYYYVLNQKKATMCGGYQKAYMCGKSHMCPGKVYMGTGEEEF